MNQVLWIIIACGALSIVYGALTTRSLLAASAGNASMHEIAAAIQEGAPAYLSRQYTTIAIVGVVIFLIVGYFSRLAVALGFAIGAILSGAAGFIGMNVSVRANVRTAQASSSSGLAEGLSIAFRAGAITGLLVAGLALLGVTIYFLFLTADLHSRRTTAPSSIRSWRSASAPRSSRSSPGWAAASSRRARTSAAISSARSKRAFPRTIRATRPPSPTTSETMSAIVRAWRPTCSRPMR